jgi:hypothetical protein
MIVPSVLHCISAVQAQRHGDSVQLHALANSFSVFFFVFVFPFTAMLFFALCRARFSVLPANDRSKRLAAFNAVTGSAALKPSPFFPGFPAGNLAAIRA